MNESKLRTMDVVMDQIHQHQSKSSIFGFLLKPVLIPAAILIIALVVINFPKGNSPIDEPIVLSSTESERIAEIAYLSTNLFVLGEPSVSNSIQFLDTSDTTEFESESERINLYFDTLRVFLEDDLLQDQVAISILENEDFEQLMEFSLRDTTYQLYMTIQGEIITGELHVGDQIFTFSGTVTQENDEFSIELDAISGTDKVTISYSTEGNQSFEKKYNIQSQIDGISENKEVYISFENNESKVVISENDNQYLLKKELEGTIFVYKLEYKINGVNGQATIIEGTDLDGNATYSYHIKEGDVEKEINQRKPQKDENPGNSENPGSDGNNPNNQLFPFIEEKEYKSA